MPPFGVYTENQAIDQKDYWKRIAAARLNVSSDRLVGFFHPIATVGEYDSADFSASGTGLRAYIQGYYRLDTGGATGQGRYTPGINAAAAPMPLPVAAGAATKFWIGMRAKFPTGTGANAISGIVLRDAAAANQFTLGQRGSQSTTNFVVFGASGTPFDTGMALDTAVHDFEIYRADGATTVPVIDGVPRTTGNARPTNDCGIDLTVTDSAGAQRQMDVAWYSIYVVSP